MHIEERWLKFEQYLVRREKELVSDLKITCETSHKSVMEIQALANKLSMLGEIRNQVEDLNRAKPKALTPVNLPPSENY